MFKWILVGLDRVSSGCGVKFFATVEIWLSCTFCYCFSISFTRGPYLVYLELTYDISFCNFLLHLLCSRFLFQLQLWCSSNLAFPLDTKTKVFQTPINLKAELSSVSFFWWYLLGVCYESLWFTIVQWDANILIII